MHLAALLTLAAKAEANPTYRSSPLGREAVLASAESVAREVIAELARMALV